MSSVFQLIDTNGQFAEVREITTSEKRSFQSWLSSHESFMSRGNDYYVIAILGAQSSGKSTLLNLTFGTTFEVMDESIARTRTTLGVWASIPRVPMPGGKEGSLIVLDLEGADSAARDEDNSFERKTSLFALAIAGIVMINIWLCDVGRYHASNFGLLRMVFELYLSLLQHERATKTLIIFIIRDHSRTPRESIISQISFFLTSTWMKISKPPQFIDTQPEQFFDFEFIFLPHMEYKKAEFMEAVTDFRSRVGFLLHPKYQKHDLPSDGLAHFASEIWKVIQLHRDLNLPGQRELLAIFRCDEIKEIAFSDLLYNIQTLGMRANELTSIRNFILNLPAEYRKHGDRYVRNIKEKKQQELADQALDELWHLYKNQITLVTDDCIAKLGDILNSSNLDSIPIEDVPAMLVVASGNCIYRWNIMAKACIMEGSKWRFVKEAIRMEELVEKCVGKARQEQLTRITKLCLARLNTELTSVFEEAMYNIQDNMWNQIGTAYRDSILSVNKFFIQTTSRDVYDASELKKHANILCFGGTEACIDQAKHMARGCKFNMEKRFADFFLFEGDHPRRWKSVAHVLQCFLLAKCQGEKVLDLYSYMRMQPQDSNITFFARRWGSMPTNSLLDVPVRDGKEVAIDSRRVLIQVDDRRCIWNNYCSKLHVELSKALQQQEARLMGRTWVDSFLLLVGIVVIVQCHGAATLLLNPLVPMLCLSVTAVSYALTVLFSTLFKDPTR
ncbi:GTP-binding protein [Pelomyxa schiedti]|nr:GTP-binding protein [Pelomyxa schiedti]